MIKKLLQKCKQIRKDKNGFTLIEMVITTAIVATFFTMVVMLLPPWITSYHNMVNLSYARQVSASIFSALENQVMLADNVRESSSVSGTIEGRNKEGLFAIPQFAEDGTLLIEGLIYDKDFYKGMDVTMTCSAVPGENCTVVLTFFGENGTQILQRTRVIKLSGKSA